MGLGLTYVHLPLRKELSACSEVCVPSFPEIDIEFTFRCTKSKITLAPDGLDSSASHDNVSSGRYTVLKI